MAKLTELNVHMFKQIERLSNPELKGEELAAEIQRGKTMAALGANVITSNQLVLKAMAFAAESGLVTIPESFGLEQKNVPAK